MRILSIDVGTQRNESAEQMCLNIYSTHLMSLS